MKTISKPIDNMGGLIKIWAVPSNVFSINGKTVSISDLTNVYEIYCTPSSLDFKEPEVFNESGTSYISTINGFIPGITEPNLEAIEYIERRKWVVIIQDGNINFRAVGSSFEPLRMRPEESTGSDTTGRAGYRFSFSGLQTSRSKFIDNPFT